MTARKLPGTAGTCRDCQQPIVWATTVAGPHGRGGKRQAFNPLEDPAGNVAVWAPHHRFMLARALHKDETHDREAEYLAMPHVATCQPTLQPAATVDPSPGVVDLARYRQTRRASR